MVFDEVQVNQLENIGLRLVGIYLPSNATGLSWSKAYPDPEYRWSTTTLEIEQDRFNFNHGATMLGRTHFKDSETGEYLNLNVLDVDCQTVFNRLSIPIRQILDVSSWDWVTDRVRSLVDQFLSNVRVVNGDYNDSLLDIFKKSTFVTKTRKSFGHHIYWLSRQQRKALGTADCMKGFEFEIKTDDSLGLCTLPGSAHKDDANFRYAAVGITDHILANDLLYDLVFEMFKDCLSNGKLDDNDKSYNTNTNTNTNNYRRHRDNSSLSNELKNMTTLLIIDNSVIIERPHRHNTLVSIADSLLFKHSATKSNAELKRFFIQVNNQCCRPEPQPDSDVERIWKDATEYVSSSKKKVTPDDIAFVIKTMKKEAPHDEISIKQLLYGMSSAFTKLPIHHNVNSRKSGSGKTYDLTLTAGYFPNKYVIPLAGVSDKGFIHEEGIQIIVDEDTGATTPIASFVKNIELEIENLNEKIEDLGAARTAEIKSQKKELKKQIKDYESKIEELYSKSQKLILLDNRIVLVLDTAQEGVFNALMSIISQDTPKDQLYQFTDKKGSGKLGATKNRFRGTPCMFTTQVIDDTRQVRYQEKNRRFIHLTPNTSREKIHSATSLIGQRFGLLPEEYDQEVVSREDKERAKGIVSDIVNKLMEHSQGLDSKESGIKIPFYESIVHCLNSGAREEANEWVMTVMDRMMRYLTIITKVNMDSRPKIIDTEEGIFYPIAMFDDLKETLQLMSIASSAIRPYIANWYNKAFLQAFDNLGGKPQVYRDAFDRVIASEVEVGLTTKDLAEATKEYMHIPKPSRNEILRDYIYPLLNQGIINKSKSVINGKEIILSPAEEGKIFSMFTDENDKEKEKGVIHHHRLEINDSKFYPMKDVIEESYRFLSRQYSRGGVKNNDKKYLLVDPDGNEITVKELIDRYLNNPETCFRVKDIVAVEDQARSILLTEGSMPVRGYEERYHYFYAPACSIILTEFSKKDIEETPIPNSEVDQKACLPTALPSNVVHASQPLPSQKGTSSTSSTSSRIFKLWPGGDIWGCQDCDIRGDRFVLEDHTCRGVKKQH